jgi:hypothetical protein
MNDTTSATPRAYAAIIDDARHSIDDHLIDYGDPAKNYERAATVASLILNKPITPYEITMIKLAVKLSRIAETPDLRKSYVELIACAGLAGEFVNAGPITTKRMAQALKRPTERPIDPPPKTGFSLPAREDTFLAG